jgi:GNAT superfamily N-acetyltransferase
MANDKLNDEALREAPDSLFQALRHACWERLTTKQKEFLSLPGFVEQSGQYLMTHQGAKAWLAPRGEEIWLAMIQTDEAQREKGQASLLLQKICALADQVGVTLSLRAEPKALKIGLDQDQLVGWYSSSRFGFKGDWPNMTRPPREAK